MADEITIKIKSPTPTIPSDLSFTVSLSSTISDLKSRIQASLSNGTEQTIVLIYRGKILPDSDPISKTVGAGAYGEGGSIKEGDTVAFHAIFRSKPGAAPTTPAEKKVETEAITAPEPEPTAEPAPTQSHPTLNPADMPRPYFPAATSAPYSPAPLQPREWRSQFASLASQPATISHSSISTGLTLRTSTNQEFRVSTRRSPEGGFLLVGPDGAAAIVYPDTLSASQQAPVVSVPGYTFRMRGASLLGAAPGAAIGGAAAIPMAMGGMGGVPVAAAAAVRVGGLGGANAQARQEANIADGQVRLRDRTNELWLALKLGALLWLLTDRRDMRRTLGMWFAAIMIFATQTGLLRYIIQTLSSLYTEFFPPLHPPNQPNVLPRTPGPAAATQGVPNPNDLAARLLQQQQENRGIQGMYRNVERVVGLFIASLMPEVAERRVRGIEQAAVRDAPAAVAPAPVVEEVPEVRDEGSAEGMREGRQNVELGGEDLADLPPAIDGERERERELVAA